MGVVDIHTNEARALCLAAPPESARSLAALQVRLRETPGSARDWSLLGQHWQQLARQLSDPGYELNVAACASLASAIEPDGLPAQLLQTQVELSRHQFAAAAARASRLRSQFPEDPQLPGLLSDALLELGEYQQAEAAARIQMTLAPGMASYARLAYLRWLQNDAESARLLWREALVGRSPAQPEASAWVLTEVGRMAWLQGDAQTALALLEEADRALPDYPAAALAQARIHLAEGRADAALRHAQRAHRVRASVVSAWLSAGACKALGDELAAQAWEAQALIQGQRGDRLALAEFLLAGQRDPARALTLLAQERVTRGGIWLDALEARAHFQLGAITRAQELSQLALRLDTPDPELKFHGGLIALAAGEKTSGRALLQAALALNPRFDAELAARARELLDSPNLSQVQ